MTRNRCLLQCNTCAEAVIIVYIAIQETVASILISIWRFPTGSFCLIVTRGNKLNTFARVNNQWP